ncbi:MAG: hypothetical protein ABMB14_20590 [Myxococcota bacterium]
MRLLALWLVVVSVPAFGKEKSKDKYEGEGILPTGIESFDSVFGRVGEIDKSLTKSDNQLKSAKTNLNTALGLKKGTPVTDGLAELQKRGEGKLSVAVDKQAVPKLTVTDAVPSNVQSAVDAVNVMTVNFSSSLTELTALKPEIDGLVKQTSKMPMRLKDEFSEGGASIIDTLIDLPKTSKALSHNVSLTAGMPERAANLTTRFTEILSVVSTDFGGSKVKPLVPAPKPGAKPAPKPAPKPKPKPN